MERIGICIDDVRLYKKTIKEFNDGLILAGKKIFEGREDAYIITLQYIDGNGCEFSTEPSLPIINDAHLEHAVEESLKALSDTVNDYYKTINV